MTRRWIVACRRCGAAPRSAQPVPGAIYLIGSATERVFGAQVGATTLENVHPATACEGRGCPIHHPSDHRLKDAPLNWRDDRGLMERICPHGIGHPDPDDLAFKASIGRDGVGVHGCDGCCRTPSPAPAEA